MARRVPLWATTCLLVLTACANVRDPAAGRAMKADRSLDIPGPVASSVPATSDRLVLSSQIVSAWFSAQQAFETAALTADPFEPDLAVTTMDPQLTSTRSLLARMRAAGQIARGGVRYGRPVVKLIGPDEAIVQSCAHDAEIVVSASTGAPAPGVPGQVDFELFDSTMELSDGEWRLVTQQVGVGQCDRS